MYVIYNHNIINMYVLSYQLLIKIIFGVSITILSMKKLSYAYYTRGDQKVRGKVLLNRIGFIDCNENS